MSEAVPLSSSGAIQKGVPAAPNCFFADLGDSPGTRHTHPVNLLYLSFPVQNAFRSDAFGTNSQNGPERMVTGCGETAEQLGGHPERGARRAQLLLLLPPSLPRPPTPSVHHSLTPSLPHSLTLSPFHSLSLSLSGKAPLRSSGAIQKGVPAAPNCFFCVSPKSATCTNEYL